MDVTLPKAATITAGGDITNLNYLGQNVSADDVTSITAFGNILFGSISGEQNKSIQVGGPGYAVIQAGGTIDLGYSQGIQALGNANNPAALSAGETGASLIVAAGMGSALSPQEVVTSFFSALDAAGKEYVMDGEDAAGAAVIDQARASIIAPFLALAQSKSNQDITMTSSQIVTSGGGSLFVIATGSLNVGTTQLSSSSTNNTIQPTSTGILTETGGAINVFTIGDVNVNQSRIMTFQGGDITGLERPGQHQRGQGRQGDDQCEPADIFLHGTAVCTLAIHPPCRRERHPGPYLLSRIRTHPPRPRAISTSSPPRELSTRARQASRGPRSFLGALACSQREQHLFRPQADRRSSPRPPRA